jgi:hypothetical protein
MKIPFVRFGFLVFNALVASAFSQSANVSTEITPGGGHLVVEAHGVPTPAPLFFSVRATNVIHLGANEVAGEIALDVRIVQGRPEVLTLGVQGAGEVVAVTGDGLRDWAVRETKDGRFLDLRPALVDGQAAPKELHLTVRTRIEKPQIPGALAVPILTSGDAVGLVSEITLLPDEAVEVRVTKATGLLPLEADAKSPRFASSGAGALEVTLASRGSAFGDAELVGAQLFGQVDDAAQCVNFQLRGEIRGRRVGARMPILSGLAAFSDVATGDGWHLELRDDRTELVFDRVGNFPIDLHFAAAITDVGGWRRVDFQMPAGAVVPLVVEGLPVGTAFDPAGVVVPDEATRRGFLPAGGQASLGWRRTRDSREGTLFFTSNEQSDVRVGAGLLRQTTRIDFRVLQGKLPGVTLRLDGPGEILAVEGANVLGWSVAEKGGGRTLAVRLSRPFEKSGVLTVRSQTPLGAFPVRAELLHLTPQGGVRHSGIVRVANDGAVRLEVTDVAGMMQLAPGQFPGGPVEGGVRQVFVYRFPSGNYACRIVANQILPEVGVSQIVTYELGDTDRVIVADLELDIREAPLREWSLEIPEDYAVVVAKGGAVADYAAESGTKDGRRRLKILFDGAVSGRQLIQLRLEKNQAAAAGGWELPSLAFPGAKSVRGYVGVVATPGFRILPEKVGNLVEMPLSYFPRQVPGLQQAYRLRAADWTAALKIETLGRSVEADVFHLYSLKEGVVYGSVLVNYFVVGAPANEWRIAVPASAGNIDVVGQNVQREWRREGDVVIVPLHQPVLGGATLLVTFEQPMSARGGVIRPGEVRPLGVQGERGFVQVVSPLQVKSQVVKADGNLLKLEPPELPAEYRLLTSSPSLAVYQYTARPFALAMNIEWYAPAETVDQLVDFAKLSSHVSRDGQIVTDAHYFVKTRGRKALRLVLPEGVKLWEVRAAGETVNARADGGETLIPLPPQTNPNEPVEVVLRLGQASSRAGAPVLSAPRAESPTVISEWTIGGDPGRRLVPRGGTAELSAPVLTETGFEWLSARAPVVAILFLLGVGLAGGLLRRPAGWQPIVGFLIAALVVFVAMRFTLAATMERRANVAQLTYSAPVVPAGESVTIQLANVVTWQAMISGWGVAAAVGGCGLLGLGMMRGRRSAQSAGALLLLAGILSQRGGAIGFFALVAAATFFALLLPTLVRWLRRPRVVMPPAAAALLALLVGIPALRAEVSPPAESIVQMWKIHAGRLFGEIDLRVRGVSGDSFLLLRPPAVLTSFQGDGLRISKAQRGGETRYFVVLDKDGVFSAHVQFESPAVNDSAISFAGTTWRGNFQGESVVTFGSADDFRETWHGATISGTWVSTSPGAATVTLSDGRVQKYMRRADGTLRRDDSMAWSEDVGARGIPLLTGPAVVQRVTVSLDEGGWEFVSPAAVSVRPLDGLASDQSGATLVLRPAASGVIQLRAKTRDVAMEKPEFYAEAANLFIPGPGVVNGICRVTIRPVQGQVSTLELEVPKGFTVGDVRNGPVSEWRFDPKSRQLRVVVEPAQAATFRFDVETQLGTDALPVDLALEPIRVGGAAGEVGMIGLAFGDDAQPENVRGLSAVNLEDFDGGLIPTGKGRRPLATLQQVFRYGREGGRVSLRVAPVAPEIRVKTKQVISFGDDRIVLAADLNVTITRAGLFKLSFALPAGMEVEAISGAALGNWTEATEAGARVITLQLNGRTIGEQNFALTLTGAAPAARKDWAVPQLQLREATRQTGEIFLVPERGLRLLPGARENVVQMDPTTVGDNRPGVLAFRLLQTDWRLSLGIEALDPWVTAQALQEITVREGQTLTRLAVRYRVENAAVKSLRLRLPGLGDNEAQTVRGSGTAVSDLVKVPGEKDLWEIRFQRGIVGETDVQIEFQGQNAREQGRESIVVPVFEGARQVAQFVSLRGSGRIDLDANVLPRGWQRVDWSAVPADLQDRSDRSVPTLCFRVAEPEGPLAVNIHRHEVADALKLRVTRGALTTLVSPRGPTLTSVQLTVDVVEKGSLRVRLPKDAQLFSAFVNEESAPVVREGDEYLLNVSPRTDADRSAAARFVYAVPDRQSRALDLAGPGFNVPLVDVAWRVVVPAGYALAHYRGALVLKDEESVGRFGISDYVSRSSSLRALESKKAEALIEQANTLLRGGEQQQAGEVLSRAANAISVDEATNEDARVQLRTLKTQQAVIGLNTRRQRLYLDNKGADGVRNDQLELAASQNPFMQGRTNFDPQQMDQLLVGNSAEENTALRGIAGRIVEQQLAAEPVGRAIDVTIPESGRVLTFTRSIQVDGEAPLALDLRLERTGGVNGWFAAALLVVGVVVAGAVMPWRRNA